MSFKTGWPETKRLCRLWGREGEWSGKVGGGKPRRLAEKFSVGAEIFKKMGEIVCVCVHVCVCVYVQNRFAYLADTQNDICMVDVHGRHSNFFID